MYRLLSLQYSNLFCAKLIVKKITARNPNQTCSFCKAALLKTPGSESCQYPRHNPCMFYSTEATSSASVMQNHTLTRKKKKFNLKRYTELLQVSDGSGSLQKMTKVNKLKAKELSLLMEESVVLDIRVTSAEATELLDEMSKTAEAKLVEEAQEQELLEDSNADSLECLEDTHLPDQKLGKKIQTKQQALQAMFQKLEKEGKAESLAQNLAAYLDLCISCNLPHRGLSTLMAYRARNKKSKVKGVSPIINVLPYNVILSGFAAKGHLPKCSEIMDIITSDNITPNIDTFVYCFECIGRTSENAKSNLKLNAWAKLLESQGYSFNCLFEEGIFISDRSEKVLLACQRLQPDFKPCIKLPNSKYTNKLLEELNTPYQGKESPCHGLFTPDELRKLAADQLAVEIQGSVIVKSIEKITQPPATTKYYRNVLAKSQTQWRANVAEAFHRNLETLRLQHQGYKGLRQMTLYPFLKVLEPDEYIDIIMQEIRRLAEGSETFSPSLQLLYRDIGARVLTKYQIQSKIQSNEVNKTQKLYQHYCEWFASSKSDFSNMRIKWHQLLENSEDGPIWNVDKKTWPNHLLVNLGKFLYNIILKDVKIDVNMLRQNQKKCHILPAFYSLYRSQGKFVKEEIKPHPILSRLYRGAAQVDLTFDADKVPMLCPPIPWFSVKHGGHLVVNTDIVRLPLQAAQQWQRLLSTPIANLYPIFDCLNQLGSVPWKISEPMLDIVIDVFNSGGSSKLDIPEPPSACPPPEQITADMSKIEKCQAYRKRIAVRRKKAEMYSLWCDTLYRLSLANHFRKQIFWLPHNMDFRGRVYPCPPHLNHMGSDMARALLCFAKGEPLGKNGLNWLKIHIVNLTGLKKKESVDKRLEYAESIMNKILDSADNPLTGEKWWMNSDEPWQTLACCKEIANALRSADPEKYICHFPIHQDGSCNGLQHYAALGRDEAGAVSVNLAPASIPQDVYSCVAVLVERERFKDAADGLKIAQILDGFVRRKVIKQTVMTTVYGVTRFGARLQIARQLKDIDTFPKDYVWQASTYLVGKTFESLREMFTSTKEIQDWFTESARLISHVAGQNVEWITPLGLPIVQPYSRIRKVDGLAPARRLQEFFNMDMFERPNVMKQKNAFPPNFIHSLDSSHMMLTSLFCQRQGITFVSVHDCFWTHPSTVAIMNKVCREQFVRLHQQPILEDLSEYLIERYSFSDVESTDKISSVNAAKLKLNKVLTQVPPRGTFDLSQVLDSVYFFS